jgi:hypothetical protein
MRTLGYLRFACGRVDASMQAGMGIMIAVDAYAALVYW